jgi:two-component system nitrate/nitrite response regulator NarL
MKRSGRVEAHFLIVDDVTSYARGSAQLLRPMGEVTQASSVADALGTIGLRRGWTAAVIDLSLPDGDGVEVIEAIRRQDLVVPVLAMTVEVSQTHIDRLFDLRARLTHKPVDPTRLRQFAVEAITIQAERYARPEDIVRVWQDRHDLAPAHAVILRSRLKGMSRRAIANMMRITPGTMKAHVHNLLQRTGDKTLDSAVLRALSEAWDGHPAATPEV